MIFYDTKNLYSNYFSNRLTYFAKLVAIFHLYTVPYLSEIPLQIN